jgi:hypothetical protein
MFVMALNNPPPIPPNPDNPDIGLLDQLVSYARIINWQNTGILGGMVYQEDHVANVVTGFGADPTGVADSTTAFQNAIDSLAATGGIVWVPDGDYLLTAKLSIDHNSVVLRGNGHLNSRLFFTIPVDGTTQHNCITIGLVSNSTAYRAVTSGYTRGSTHLTLANVTNFNVGDTLMIKEDNDASVMYTTPSWASQSWDSGFAMP